MQADALIESLQSHDPNALFDCLIDAAAQGRHGWREPILRSLAELGRDDIGEELSTLD